jgi:hypothetical protein
METNREGFNPEIIKLPTPEQYERITVEGVDAKTAKEKLEAILNSLEQ